MVWHAASLDQCLLMLAIDYTRVSVKLYQYKNKLVCLADCHATPSRSQSWLKVFRKVMYM